MGSNLNFDISLGRQRVALFRGCDEIVDVDALAKIQAGGEAQSSRLMKEHPRIHGSRDA
jgi:hypothetical protein